MSSRNLDDLTPNMADNARLHIDLCKKKGVELLIYCTLRNNDEQTELYAIGRSKPGKIVTNARAGESAHNPDNNNKASAYDCCPMINGKPMWDGNHQSWTIVGSCGEEAGLTWSGRWTGKLKEIAHFQDTNWRKP